MFTYIKESFEELKNNITWPQRNNLQNMVVIVLVFSVVFSLIIWGIDTILSRLIRLYFDLIL